jgi:penicillin-binding protein 1C
MKKRTNLLFLLVPLTGFILIAAAAFLLRSQRPSVPSFENFKLKFTSSDRLILDRYGRALHEIRFDTKVRRFDWVSLSQISPALVENVIFAEDHRFYSHHGVDWWALAVAFGQKISGHSQRGASTITMQLTEFLDSLSGKTKLHRGYSEKIKQIGRALDLEQIWSKDQILEAYLNLVPFKGELQGIASTSYGLFEQDPSSLDREESAVLTALIRSPNSNDEKIFWRACRQFRQLFKSLNSGETDCSPHLQQLALQVNRKVHSIRPLAEDAPHIARQVLAAHLFKDQQRVRTTLDLRLQRIVVSALRRQILALKNQNMNDGAAIVLDNATGEILAYAGNIGKESSAPYVDGVKALRQAGSTLKPFLYAMAFDQKLLTPASVLNDAPLEISVQSGLYRPQNYDRNFRAFVTARNSLASSLNVPAVKALEMVGVTEFVDKLKDLGFIDLERADIYGPSIALGSADVKLIQLANAYRTLANGGNWSEPTFLFQNAALQTSSDETKVPHRIFSQDAAYLISNILSDREARSTTFGLENMLATRFWTAAKTGTSKDMRDNWCLGYSRRYTVGVWAGNFSGTSMWGVSGVQGAAPAWLEIMNALHESEPSVAPPLPEGIVQKKIYFPSWKVSKNEVFIRGTEPLSGQIQTEAQPLTKISYPQDSSMIAIDPDIPLQNQKVFFSFENADGKTRVILNDKDLGPAGKIYLWKPQTGHFRLKLKDAQGSIIDQIQFEVRGRNLTRNN